MSIVSLCVQTLTFNKMQVEGEIEATTWDKNNVMVDVCGDKEKERGKRSKT